MYKAKKLFGSGTRVKILKLLFQGNPNTEFFIRDICRRTDSHVNSVRSELKNLEQLGVVKPRNDYPKIWYSLNSKSEILPSLRNLIMQ